MMIDASVDKIEGNVLTSSVYEIKFVGVEKEKDGNSDKRHV
jgi:hypothetical protein